MNLQLIVNSAKFDHSRYVSEISGILAESMGYSSSEAGVISEAALFHDLGKCDIPPEILVKPGSLTSEEFSIVKRHTDLGSERIRGALRVLSAACVIAENHHEKWDGSGYHNLSAEAIHPYARLVSVADVFDALVSKRSYKDAWNLNDVIDYLRQNVNTQFDEKVVGALLDHIDEIVALYK